MKNYFSIAKKDKDVYTFAEINANIFNIKCMGIIVFAAVFTTILNDLGIFTVEKRVMVPMMFITVAFLLVPMLIFIIHDVIREKSPTILQWKGLKLIIISVTYICFLILCTALSFHAVLLVIIPMLMTAQYRYNKKLLFWVAFATILLVPTSVYGSFFLGVPDRNLIKNALSDADALIIANRFKIATSKRMVEILFHYIMPRMIQVVTVVVLATGISKRNARMLDNQVNLMQVANDELNKRNVMQNKVIEDLASVIETRDIGTGEHVKRTKKYVGIIARELIKYDKYKNLLKDEEIRIIEGAAPLHDVGKIAVPDYILLKPAKLTDEEFEKIKYHAQKGGEMIKNIFSNFADEKLVEKAYNIAIAHHEKWDGKGYPHGLSGEEIPLEARLMAIADVFDALVSDRVYKKAMPPEEAFDIILDGAGTHFDPDIIKILESIKDEFIKAATEEI
ncbi:MAG: HD domain-containing protein [Clostridia bacterium]|nr:HD domain-containing protein [Clostridia bacterium]